MIEGAWALVPARSFRTGKSRLAADPQIGPRTAAIARALFDRVLRVLSRSPSIAGILVATDGDDVIAAARRAGAEVLIDPAPLPLATIIDRGLGELAARGAAAAIVTMADLPLLAPRHIDQLCAALETADLAIAPDRDLLGTNALATRLPAPISTCFGNRDSFPRHLVAADRLRVVAVRSHGLAFDVDLPAHLDELLAAGWTPGVSTTPPRPWRSPAGPADGRRPGPAPNRPRSHQTPVTAPDLDRARRNEP